MRATARIAAALRAPTYAPPTKPGRVEHPHPHPHPPELPAALRESPIGSANRRALELLRHEMLAEPDRHFWLALVPGTSEQWGHHRAPPREHERRGVRISAEFERRLARAASLLRLGVVRFVLISGGSVDPGRPDYNEALRGRDHLLSAWPDPHPLPFPDLADRVLVDPLASTSVTNVRNADKLCAHLGLERLLIATTMPPNAKIWPANLPVVHQTSQGWYFLHHRLSTYDARCRRLLGYTLGAFEWFEAEGNAGERVAAIAHHGFDAARLHEDDYGP